MAETGSLRSLLFLLKAGIPALLRERRAGLACSVPCPPGLRPSSFTYTEHASPSRRSITSVAREVFKTADVRR